MTEIMGLQYDTVDVSLICLFLVRLVTMIPIHAQIAIWYQCHNIRNDVDFLVFVCPRYMEEFSCRNSAGFLQLYNTPRATCNVSPLKSKNVFLLFQSPSNRIR